MGRQALKVNRIAAHVDRALTNGGAPRPRGYGIALYCGDKPLPAEMNLLTVRQFLWKQGGDMLLTYGEVRLSE